MQIGSRTRDLEPALIFPICSFLAKHRLRRFSRYFRRFRRHFRRFSRYFIAVSVTFPSQTRFFSKISVAIGSRTRVLEPHLMFLILPILSVFSIFDFFEKMSDFSTVKKKKNRPQKITLKIIKKKTRLLDFSDNSDSENRVLERTKFWVRKTSKNHLMWRAHLSVER